MRVALLGCGTVGAQVARALAPGTASAEELAARVGTPLDLVAIVVRDLDAPRPDGVETSLLTTDAAAAVAEADIVVEVMGGIEPARTLLLAAMDAGASVVTANKALLGEHGQQLHAAAARAGVDLYFEAAVAGAIPIIRPLRESLAGDRVERVLGIVNGTTNYVLDAMDTSGAELADAVAQAQRLGYAEADPSADVQGADAAAKAAILATLAFHTPVSVHDVHAEGIGSITAADVAAAHESGAVIKLLAIADRHEAGVQVRVHPALLPRSHPLAGVRGAYNAVFVQAASAGELMFYGQGAGGAPTASAVLGDLVTIARHRLAGSLGQPVLGHAALPVVPMSEVVTRYHVRLVVDDRPGVLATIAAVFADHGVSIETVRQTPERGGAGTPPSAVPAVAAASGAAGHGPLAWLVVTTHAATDAALAATVEEIGRLDAVAAVASVLRVEGT